MNQDALLENTSTVELVTAAIVLVEPVPIQLLASLVLVLPVCRELNALAIVEVDTTPTKEFVLVALLDVLTAPVDQWEDAPLVRLDTTC